MSTTRRSDASEPARHPQQPAEGDRDEVDEALRRQGRDDTATAGAADATDRSASTESASDADAGRG